MSQRRKDKPGKALSWAIVGIAALGIAALCTQFKRAESSGKVRIRYTIWGDSPDTTKMFKDLVAEFERRHPRIDVEMLIVPWDAYHRKIFTMFAANSQLDVMRLSTAYFDQLLDRGAILHLDKFIERDKEEVDLDDFFDGTLDACRKDGHYYGLPMQAYPWGFYYNKNLFKEAGLDPPDRTWTWRGKFLDAAKRLTRIGPDGSKRYGCIMSTSLSNVMRMAISNGGNMFNEDNTRCVFNSAETRETVQFVYDLIVTHKVAPMPGEQNGLLLFTTGRAAMLPALRSLVPMFRAQLPFEWDVGPTPGWAGKPPRVMVSVGNPRVVSSRTRHPEEAWQFLKFLTGKEAARMLARSGRYCMARRSAAESEEFLKTTPPEHNQYFLDEPNLPIQNKVYRVSFPRYAKLLRIFNDNFHLLLQGELGDGPQAVEEFCRVVERKVNDLIAAEAKRKQAVQQ
ncbi:hypothetical protein LCGC14_1316700 [marine sediment metagenome]|uniref:Sugar ABC transporter substrate-binding protein n=1 Tax=marine sediment metagenome TaxID=412755 RepID=A0A0F9KKQ4_9ZZZZ